MAIIKEQCVRCGKNEPENDEWIILNNGEFVCSSQCRDAMSIGVPK